MENGNKTKHTIKKTASKWYDWMYCITERKEKRGKERKKKEWKGRKRKEERKDISTTKIKKKQ